MAYNLRVIETCLSPFLGIIQHSSAFPNSLDYKSFGEVVEILLKTCFKPFFMLFGEIFVYESTNYDHEELLNCTDVLQDVDLQ